MAENPLPWGTDNVQPVRDPDSLWRHWAKDQMWLGGEGKGRYIGKVKDYMEDTDFHITYQITGFDQMYVPTLVRVSPKPIADQDSEDLLLGQTSDSFRCYVDKSVTPHRLQVDGRTYVNARNAATARVYRGNPLTGTEEIVSLMLDQSGRPVGTNIPLQLCVIPNGQNVAQYYVPTAYTTLDIKDGEFMYVVLFDDTGAFLSSKSLRAVVTSFLMSTDLSIKAVTGIALEGALMSKTVPNRLEVPLNLTLNSINLFGVVNYNSGAPSRSPVDGQRFKLLGLETFAPSQAGEHFEMKLRCQLAAGEVSFTGGTVGNSRFITAPIDVVVVDVENQLTVKLYPYLEWMGTAAGYRLRWFMLNLDRNILYDVTGLIEFGSGSNAFVPNLYGVKQQMTVIIDLSKVNGSWRSWRFVQTVSVTLMKPGDNTGTKWRIGFDPNQSPEYGEGLEIRSRVINQNLNEMDISSGFTTLEAWLQAFYYNTKPLSNPAMEEGPVYPTHVKITDGFGTNMITVNIEENWNKRITTNFNLTQDQTWYLHFLKQGPVSDLVLSIAATQVQQVAAW